jgi:hypothetical protein
LVAFVASFLVLLDVIDKLAVPIGVIALFRGIPMGEARHAAVLVVGYGSSRRHSGSCRALRLVPHPRPCYSLWPFSGKVDATISGVCYSSGGLFLLLLFRFPVFWMAEAFNDSRALSSVAA